MEKLYKIEFMEYTNFMRDTVGDENRKIGERKYIYVGKEPFIAKENQLEELRQYGNGFRSCLFVGNLY